MHGIGAEIEPHAKPVFHQPEVFIASPKQGLKVGRDLQSDLQRNLRPPVRLCAVEVSRSPPIEGHAGVEILISINGTKSARALHAAEKLRCRRRL
jgi:hypothetical protein